MGLGEVSKIVLISFAYHILVVDALSRSHCLAHGLGLLSYRIDGFLFGDDKI